MTVLHSRNADAADPADVADAADVKDPQDAAAEPDLREDLGRYAELGAFTLTAETHAWYAAVDTVATPEDARAASTALAELRGSDLQQTWEAVLSLAADTKLDEPDTVAKTALLVEMLQRVHRTSAALFPAAYDADLGALAAATADSTWRRENGVKLSWLRGRSLRKQAVALATDRRIRREDLHEALTSAEIERRAWAALAPAGTLPRVPTDGALVDRTAQAFETINTGLRGLARLLPDHDLDGLPFAELIDLVERLAADEGTLYRLPTIRGLRAGLEEAGLADLLAELATAKADRRAAEAAYTARQALASGQRDGLAEKSAAAVEAAPVEEPGAEDAAGAVVEDDADVDIDGATGTEEAAVEEPGTEEPTDRADAEAAALQALAGGQRDGLVEEAPAAVTAPVEDAEETAAATATAVAEAEAETKEETETEAEIEAEPASDAVAADDKPAAAQAEEETQAAVVSLPAPSPAADDLVAAATAALAEAAAADETTADTEPEAAPVAEAVEAKETAVEEPVVEAAEIAVEAEVVAEPVVEAEPEAVAVEPAVEASAVEVDEPAVEVEAVVEAVVVEPAAEESATATAVEAETVEAEVDPVVEAEAEAVVAEPAVEEPAAVTAVEAEAVVEAEPESVVEEPVAEAEAVAEEVAEPVAEPEAAVEAPAVEVEEPAVEPEPEPEPVSAAEEPVVEAEPEPVAAVEAPAAEPEADARPAKPDFTPGRPVTAYSADELLAVVRWVDGDGAERTDEELLRAAMKELGFARLGPRIKEALGAAVAAARG
ncbi:hypothetical protein DR950_35640 [Kitasatospora xanthocidica]|uniref:Uncharacterized protein n=1 Tax=Kitasatospora xanthocidica TaxID=83382 RepID=A0A373A3N9_9ACTN|nr:hypothetical protein [Kitasatospora xanthocidica]RGD62374.1 hypothetical protein DR950_35640 [Kitasatospora xanthocidica]